jgi:hypothetical protein
MVACDEHRRRIQNNAGCWCDDYFEVIILLVVMAMLPISGGSATELSATDAWHMAAAEGVVKVVPVDLDYKAKGEETPQAAPDRTRPWRLQGRLPTPPTAPPHR